MTAFAGVFLPSHVAVPLPGAGPRGGGVLTPFPSAVTQGKALSGGSRRMEPASISHWTIAGVRVPSQFVELEGKVIIYPQQLDAGLVLAAKQYTITVWSTSPYWSRMNSYSVVNLDGVQVTNADGIPVGYGPNQSRVYDVLVQANGQASVNGNITFSFQGLASPVVKVTGTRLIVWAYEPNWKTAPVETLEWMTDVIEAYNTSEQRIRLRQNPRRSIQYGVLLDGAQKLGSFKNTLYGWAQRVFAVPLWMDQQVLPSGIAVGATSIPLGPGKFDINAGQLAMLWRSSTQTEVVEIASTTSSALTLTKPTNAAWAAGTRLVPCRLGRLSPSNDITYYTGIAMEMSATFSFEPKTATGPNRLGSSPYVQMIDGLPLLTIAPEVGIGVPIETEIVTIDNGQGPWSQHKRGGEPSEAIHLRWVIKGRDAISNFLAWLEYCKGRLAPFWVPSWRNEVRMVGTLGGLDTNLMVEGCGYTKFVNANTRRNRLFFIDHNRGITVKRITAAAESGSNEVLTLDSSFGSDKTAANFTCIGFVYRARLGTDAVKLTWHSTDLIECELDLKEVAR